MIQTGHDEFENHDAVLSVKLQCKNYITFGNDNDAVREYILESGGGKWEADGFESGNFELDGGGEEVYDTQRITKKPAP